MKNFKVITVLGTRPEIIRLSMVIKKLDRYTEHILVHTGQNYDYELNKIFFEDLDIRKPNYFLNAAGNNSSETIGKIIIEVDKVLENEKPDAFLVLGDTNSCMAVIPAKRRKIPIFHMEAGNRCFDLRVPEEINRKIVDHTADINLTYSSIAREYLIREGINPQFIIKTGSPMFEILKNSKSKIDNSNIIEVLNLKAYNYFLTSIHREENIDNEKNFNKILNTLNDLVNFYDMPIIFSTHPRTRKKIEKSKIKLSSKIKIIKPLCFTAYNKLQILAKAVLSDSGTINEESSILNFHALNIRETHERPEAMEEGSVMMTGFDFKKVIDCINILENQKRGELRTLDIVDDYMVDNVSEKIIRIIFSYTDYVNKFVWKKN